MAPKPTTIGPVYSGSRMRIDNPSAGRASRNVATLVPQGYRMVENHGSYIVVEKVGGPAAPGTRPAGFVGPVAPAPAKPGTAGAAKPAAPAAAAPQQVWLDGKLVSVTLSPDGKTYTATPVKGGDAATGARPTAFSALDGQDLDPTTPFVIGPSATRPPGFVGPVATTQNVMTIAGGVQWLAQLSTRDPATYQAMVDRLHKAGYLSDKDYAATAGHWSSAAGSAFAQAARDVAVVNTTEGGQNVDLAKFLDSKQGALDAQKAASGAGAAVYTPVDRSYTDPEAIKAASKSAAQDALGRQLTPAEEAELVGHFRSLEDAAFDRIDAAQGKGGAQATQPIATGQINAYVNNDAHAQEAGNYRAAQYGDALKQLLSGR